MKIHFVENFSEGDADGQLVAMKKAFELVEAKDADIIFCASISKMSQAMSAKASTGKPLVTYCWDYYKWVHDGKNEQFNWRGYREFLKMCDLILVPSNGQKRRLKELLNLDSHVCECSINFYDHEISDRRFVLDPVRNYPEENLGWVEKACAELNIPYLHPEHNLSEEDFRQRVNECSFMTCAYREASTGGLSLMEGLYNGKRSLVSNSPYMGARDYLGPYGHYFQYDDYDDLKEKIAMLWTYPPVPFPKKSVREYTEKFTHKAFVARLKREFKSLIK